MNVSKKEAKLLLSIATLVGSLIAGAIGTSMILHNHNEVTIIVKISGDEPHLPHE
jgi:hypothetical protein